MYRACTVKSPSEAPYCAFGGCAGLVRLKRIGTDGFGLTQNRADASVRSVREPLRRFRSGQTNTGRSVSCWTHSRTPDGSASFASSVISVRNARLPSWTCCSRALGSRENWIGSQKCGGIPALCSATTSHLRTFTPGATRPFHNKGKGSNEGHSKRFGCNTDAVPYNTIKQRGHDLS